jgi:phage terminase Nu1 subunit (DNA packaging protein)
MTLSAYAERRGITKQAVTTAVKRGILKDCVVIGSNGRAAGITDPELADQEWEANADYTRAPGQASANEDLSDSAARAKYWTAELARMKAQTMAGTLIERSKVEHEWADILSRVKTRILAVPSQAKQNLPELTLDGITELTRLLRAALEELADDRD